MKIEETLEISIVWLVGYTGLHLKYGIFQHNTILKLLQLKILKANRVVKERKKPWAASSWCKEMDVHSWIQKGCNKGRELLKYQKEGNQSDRANGDCSEM